MISWDTKDPTAAVGVTPCGRRFVAWSDGALSGYGRTTYHETQAAAKEHAESIVKTKER